jgi:serine/threonine protein kinase
LEFPLDDAPVFAAFPELTFNEPLDPGGMKNAYRATLGDQPVVLKVIREPVNSDDEGLVTVPERIRRELMSMARVDHPRVIKILDGPDVRSIDGADRVWYLEPYVSGGSLSGYLGEPWNEARALDLAADLLDGVEALWSAQIVHRDIKPPNIALDADGHAVLLDLGIALVIDLTPITESVMASPRTPRYAAPEQFQMRRFAQIDFRTDLFAVGMVTYEALTGAHPFNADLEDGYLDRLLDGRWGRDVCAQCGTSEATQEFLGRLMAPQQNQRFRRIEHARSALEGCR